MFGSCDDVLDVAVGLCAITGCGLMLHNIPIYDFVSGNGHLQENKKNQQCFKMMTNSVVFHSHKTENDNKCKKGKSKSDCLICSEK